MPSALVLTIPNRTGDDLGVPSRKTLGKAPFREKEMRTTQYLWFELYTAPMQGRHLGPQAFRIGVPNTNTYAGNNQHQQGLDRKKHQLRIAHMSRTERTTTGPQVYVSPGHSGISIAKIRQEACTRAGTMASKSSHCLQDVL